MGKVEGNESPARQYRPLLETRGSGKKNVSLHRIGGETSSYRKAGRGEAQGKINGEMEHMEKEEMKVRTEQNYSSRGWGERLGPTMQIPRSFWNGGKINVPEGLHFSAAGQSNQKRILEQGYNENPALKEKKAETEKEL